MIDKKKYKGSEINNIFNDIDDISDEDKKILSECFQAYSNDELKEYDEIIDKIDNKVKNRIHKLLNEENKEEKSAKIKNKSWFIPAAIAASVMLFYIIFPGRLMITSLDQTENETEFVRKYDDIDQKYKTVKSPIPETAITYSDYRLLQKINRLWADGEKNEAINMLRTFIEENPDYPKEEIKEILHEEIKLSDYAN